MNPDFIFPLFVFAFVGSMTPGPNNVMLMASGANYGFRRTIPHMLGVVIGFAVMVVLVGVGLAGLFETWPPARIALTVVSVLYLLWLAWKIGTAAPPPEKADGEAASGRPLTFLQAALFQWVNPKAWAMGLTAVTVYAPGDGLAASMAVSAVISVQSVVSVTTWTVLGQQLRRLLTNRRRLRIFNWTMAALLVASLYPLLV